MMACSATGMLVLAGPKWFVLATVAVMAAVAVWLWVRPERIPGDA